MMSFEYFLESVSILDSKSLQPPDKSFKMACYSKNFDEFLKSGIKCNFLRGNPEKQLNNI